MEIADIELSLGFEDIGIKQGLGQVTSRKDVNIASEIISGVELKIPLIAANMSTVTNANFCNKLQELGALGVLHRAWGSIDEYCNEAKKLQGKWRAASIGISEKDIVLTQALVSSGINIIFIDVAHGFSTRVLSFTSKIRETFPDVKLVLGNTTNPQILNYIKDFGIKNKYMVDAIKVGVGQGSVCETKNTAGCTERQFSAIFKFADSPVPIISDGGIKEPADFVKAIALSNSVMAGRIFAKCPESAAPIVSDKKLYAGMASRYVQVQWLGELRNNCPEGKVDLLNIGEGVDKLLERYAGALRSGISYAGGKDIHSFQRAVRFVRFK